MRTGKIWVVFHRLALCQAPLGLQVGGKTLPNGVNRWSLCDCVDSGIS